MQGGAGIEQVQGHGGGEDVSHVWRIYGVEERKGVCTDDPLGKKQKWKLLTELKV